MTLRARKHFLLASLAIAVVCLLPNLAAAQQVTYYDFDGLTPSYTCTASSSGGSLFCFNNTTGEGEDAGFPLLFQDSYPPFVDPNPTDPPNTTSMHTTLQISDGGSEYSSAWFAVPQKVLNGFTAYVAFRLTPVTATPGDGIAFVVQNASGGGTDPNDTNDGTCVASGSGLNVSATIGGCLGYGGIDNSLAVEFDTFQNEFDPNANHIAMQSCGLGGTLLSGGLPNSPNHDNTSDTSYVSCPVRDQNTHAAAINSALPITLADGNVHQAVIEYSGATGATPYQWQVFIDPVFIAGTHTPDPSQSTAVITTIANLTQYMNLQNSGSAADSAYVGFTGASGGAVENQEILAWTFTPHSTSTQQQPLSTPGTPTTFPFGAHTYAVTYPSTGVDTSSIDMVVVANAFGPPAVAGLLAGSSFAGSACQVYGSTGGNCIVYSVYCVTHGTTTPAVPCPATSEPTIALKTAFDSDPSLVPTTAGFLQGDPLYSQIATIQVSGSTATVTCSGECAVHDGETVSIINAKPSDFSAANVTVSNSSTNVYTFNFTYASAPIDTYISGAAVTSNNLQNICNPPGSQIPCWQAARIDGTISGTGKSFSDFVALFATVLTTGASISAPPITYGQTAQITVSVTPAAATGNVSLTVGTNSPVTQSLSAGSTTFDVTGLGANTYNLSASYAAQGVYGAASATGTLQVGQAVPTVTFTGAPTSPAAFGSTFGVTATTTDTGNVLPTITGTAGICSVGAVGGTPTSATATVTMNSGTGTCNLTANWLADTNYSTISANQSTGAAPIAPTVKFTGAPVSAAYLSTFVVTATTNDTGNVLPTITGTAGICSVGAVGGTPTSATATVTMNSGTGTCNLTANWLADTNYSTISANQSTGAAPIAPTVKFTGAPVSAAYLSTFVVTATTNDTGNVLPTITGTAGICSVGAVGGTPTSATATVTMTSGTGTCSLTANWAADTNYSATSLGQSASSVRFTPMVSVTSVSVVYDGTPHPATGLVTGVGNAILGAPAITYNPGVNSVPVGAGTYQVLASFAGNSNYLPASNNTGSVVIGMFPPSVTVTGGTFAYDGNPHPATGGSVTGVGGVSLGAPVITYSPGGSSVPVTPGTYGVLASYAGSSNYKAASATASIVIGSALGLSSYSLAFGNVDLTSRTDQTITVTNVSKVSLKITNIYFNYGPGSGKDYGYFTQCGGTLTRPARAAPSESSFMRKTWAQALLFWASLITCPEVQRWSI